CARDPVTGEIFVAKLGGIVVFDPAKVHTDPNPPRMRITEVQRFGQELPLAADDEGRPLAAFVFRDVITLSFAALSFTGSTRTAYMLEGLDDDWDTAGSYQTVTY